MGTFAEQFSVYARSLVTIGDSIADHEAPLACGGLTAYGAVKKLFKHHINPGSTIGIIGAAGGLGHYAVQLAKNFGYNVVAVDLGEERLAFAKELGADQVMEPEEAAGLGRQGGVDAVLVFAASKPGFDLGIRMLRRGGLFVAVGIPPTDQGNIEISPFDFFRKGITMIYSVVGTVQDMRELVDLAAAGKVRSHIGRTAPLSELPAVFDELAAGCLRGSGRDHRSGQLMAAEHDDVVPLFERRSRSNLDHQYGRTGDRDPDEPRLRDVIGEVLRDERQRQDRTLADVAEDAAVSLQYLSEIERGRKEVSSELLHAVHSALGLELVDVLNRASERLHTARRSELRVGSQRGRPMLLAA